MKKKMAMMCIAGVMAVSLCACGNKSTQAGSDAAQTTEQSSETAATQETASEEETKVSERADYVALADLDVDEYVTLGEYKDMTVQAAKTEVTDEVIENYINGNMLTTYPITDRAVEDGDLITIDYVGKKDGEAFSGGSAEGYQLKIGSNTFIDGFEEFLWAKGYNENSLAILKKYYDSKDRIPDEIHNQFMRLIREYIVVGGMPAVVQTYLDSNHFGQVQKVQEQIILSYMDDILKYASSSEKTKVKNCYMSITKQLANYLAFDTCKEYWCDQHIR